MKEFILFLAIGLLTTGGVLVAKGLRGWATREARSEWLPTIIMGLSACLMGGAAPLGPKWMAVGALTFLAAQVLQWRMRSTT